MGNQDTDVCLFVCLCVCKVKERSGQDERVSELEHQNEELRRVIRQMRQDIEILGSQVPASAAQSDRVPSAADSLSMAANDNGLRLCISLFLVDRMLKIRWLKCNLIE